MIDLTPRNTLHEAQRHAESLDFSGCITISANIFARIQGMFDAWEIAASSDAIPREIARRLTTYREQWSAIAALYDRVALEKLGASLQRRGAVVYGAQVDAQMKMPAGA